MGKINRRKEEDHAKNTRRKAKSTARIRKAFRLCSKHYLLRKAFEGDWLPPEILWREKAAFSDAVGHSMVDDIKGT